LRIKDRKVEGAENGWVMGMAQKKSRSLRTRTTCYNKL
jgi:hypothetical protein